MHVVNKTFVGAAFLGVLCDTVAWIATLVALVDIPTVVGGRQRQRMPGSAVKGTYQVSDR